MKRTQLLLAIVGLAAVTSLLTGCTLRATADVTPTPSDAEYAQHGMETVAAEAALTAAASDVDEIPTVIPTEPPEMVEEPTPTVEYIPPPVIEQTPEPVPQPTPAPVEVTTTAQTYVVQPGDTLYSIARRFGTDHRTLAALNGIVNPNLIYVGQTLNISGAGTTPPQPSPGGSTHVVQPGENLFRIALRYNMSYLYLASYNNITNPNTIYVGQVIRIP